MNSLNRSGFSGTRISHNVRASIFITLLATTGMSLLGASWTPINSGLPGTTQGVVGLTINPAAPSTLYAWTSSGDVLKSTDSAASWTPVGGVGGVNALVIDPQKTSTLYVATLHGIVKSMDGGATWHAANSGLTGDSVSSLAIDPITSATLYAATSSGLFKSTDAAGSWNSINSGFPSDASIQNVVLDPTHPWTIYALGNAPFKSEDGGTSWAALNTVPGTIFSGYAESLAIDPVSPNTIYVASMIDGGRAAGTASIAKSTDGGQSWQVVPAGIGYAFMNSLAIDPTAPSTVYASYSGNGGSDTDPGEAGVLKSTDGGQSWNVVTVIPSASVFFDLQLAIDPSTPAKIYATYYDSLSGVGGIIKSTNSGQTWNAANAGLSNFNIRLLAFDPLHGSVFASEGETLFQSVNKGASWSSIGGPQPPGYAYPFEGEVIQSMLIDSTHPNVLFVDIADVESCCNGGLFKSFDGGATWSYGGPVGLGWAALRSRLIPDPSNSGVLTADPTNPSTIYYGLDNGGDGHWLVKSVDYGAHWNYAWNGAQGFDSKLNALAIDPTSPTTLYAGTASGLFKSSDGGATSISVGFSNSAVTVLAIDPNSPSTLYASVEGGASGPKGFQGLFKSTDGGASWIAINGGLDTLIDTRSTITALAVTPSNSNVLYAATAGLGIYQSIDGGANWNPFNDGLTNQDVSALFVTPGVPSTIYAGTSGGIFRMDDATDPWQLAITALKTAAGTDSYNFWQWDWLWQRTPAFAGAPPSFGVLGSIDNTPGLIEEIIAAGGNNGLQNISAEQWVAYYRQVIATDPWQQAIARMQAAAGTDSYNLWQWAWFWQNSPTFAGAPAGFGVLGSIDNNPGLRSAILAAGGGNGFATVSAEQWVLYYRQATCVGCLGH